MRPVPSTLRPPADLTVPAPGSTTAREVYSAALRRLLGDLAAILRPGPGAEPELRAELRAICVELRERAPGALASALRRADVGVWIRCLRPGAAASIDRAEGLRRLGLALGLALAAHRALPRPLTIPRPPRTQSSLALRARLAVPAGVDAITITDDGVVDAGGAILLSPGTASADAGEDAAFASIAGPIVLALADDNPIAAVEAHPDKEGNAVDLGGRAPAAWAGALADALDLVGAHLPALRAELDLLIQQFVPVGVDDERHLSASYQEAIGTIYLSLHPRVMTMAEAVIHEFSHNKVNALFEVDPVLDNAFTTFHRSPVRPDPRPLHGVLLAVHAFLPVAAFYEAMIAAGDPRAASADGEARLRAIVRGNHEAAEVLRAHAAPTPIGEALLAEIFALDRRFCDAWLPDGG
ncbi:MAG: HEXXH motif-containing putative peptide modification protein [Nannocystaceae bacterium]